VRGRAPVSGELVPAAATQVVIAGGGPVGLAAAVELGLRGIECLVVEPREQVSRARPRCKTINIRTMEHLRRWRLADRLRERAPLPVSYSRDVVFCTSLTGRELSRFSGVFGLADDPDRYPETGQQAPQYVLEELLREVVEELPACTLELGSRVTDVGQDPDEVRVGVVDRTGRHRTVGAQYLLGCDGPRSVVRDGIGSVYEGGRALSPNYGMVFRAPGLRERVRHGPAVQYWTV
jgi:2-polyprenyl-6-methoxyphenol hydroxylase-like FAD-dependent oxidoreductase